MKVPRSLEEWPNYTFPMVDGPLAAKIVPDELLRERFAFAGSVVLTRMEALDLCSYLDGCSNRPGKHKRLGALRLVRLLESKLAQEEAADET